MHTTPPTAAPRYSRWLFAWAALLAVCTLPLIASGGTVTSTDAGMADPEWHFAPFKLFTTRGLEQAAASVLLFIEHSHRQIGWIVGILAIVLAVWMLMSQPSPRRWLGLAVLAAVCSQGVLGKLRIEWDVLPGYVSSKLGRDIAMLHGFTGQLVFALIVVTALVLSKGWLQGEMVEATDGRKLRRLSVITLFLLLAQLAAGVLLRHLGGVAYLVVHLILAAAVLAHAVILVARTASHSSGRLRRPAVLLLALVLGMLALGAGAWWFGGGEGTMRVVTDLARDRTRIVLATAHQCLNALVLATAAVLLLRARHHVPNPNQPSAAPRVAAEVGA
jgi:heme A synthase